MNDSVVVNNPGDHRVGVACCGRGLLSTTVTLLGSEVQFPQGKNVFAVGNVRLFGLNRVCINIQWVRYVINIHCSKALNWKARCPLTSEKTVIFKN